MSSYDKVVKLACKPKAAPPKAKYLDPIIAATWLDDGAVHDVCKALSPRFREPNSTVVFKALIVLHTMIRNGATDNVLSYLSSSQVLHLGNVSAGNWEGYSTPQNLQHYAAYLESRIRAYRDLKHDVIRVQSESNRDWRNSNSIEDDANRARGSTTPGLSKSKTIAGKKLRVISVEKGLLRETKIVQNMINALAECRFYLDDLEDGLTTTTLRMLVKDLLILFQAGNEGVINVLEHYFEMSRVDAKDALSIYREFCKQTERVVEYLGVAKKLQNILNVPIPNLKHAPVSLAGALQEYLDDPNFEQNRIEYKTRKGGGDRNPTKPGDSSESATPDKKHTPSVATASPPSSSRPVKSRSSQPIVDFFSAIEEEQPTMFNPQTNSPSGAYFQQQAAANPFVSLHLTSNQGLALQAMQPQLIPAQPNPSNSFLSQQPLFQPFQPDSLMAQSPPTQPTGTRPFLQPHATGTTLFHSMAGGAQQQPSSSVFLPAAGPNPFRQSMMFPNVPSTANLGKADNPTQQTSFPPVPPLALSVSPTAAFLSSLALTQDQTTASSSGLPARPASTPAISHAHPQRFATSPPSAQPVRSHFTGSRNPFAPSVTTPPPLPKQPTLMELAKGMAPGDSSVDLNASQAGQHPLQLANPVPGVDMAGVASSFVFPTASVGDTGGTMMGSPLPGSPFSQNVNVVDLVRNDSSAISLQSNPYPGTSSATFASPTSSSPLVPHATGLAGLKAFKPTSSFGAALLEALPPIPGPPPDTVHVTENLPVPAPRGTTLPAQVSELQTSFSMSNVQPSGTMLRPQMTGLGTANPFRLSMAHNGGNMGDVKGQQPFPPLPFSGAIGSGFSSTYGPAFSQLPGVGAGSGSGQLLSTP